MRNWLTRKMITRFGNHYHYDVSYLYYMLQHQPALTSQFLQIGNRLGKARRIPASVKCTAQLVAMRHEDCGPCLQLQVQIAAEAGMAEAEIRAALLHKPEQLSPDNALAYHYAQALMANSATLPEAQQAIVQRFGDSGLVELAVVTQAARLYPMVKKGLGHSQACTQLQLGESTIALGRHMEGRA
ncbi:hypothetical protein [Halioxenophilus sp. WMMB6]|uniref:hypothetical protein n=1 Tax=Halioxenophilus sp. WMMB6 TaxID=3073815 RepID=UPI00295E2882|nr:hypothetical protein [Halioxenophilus sp. WMMB6]